MVDVTLIGIYTLVTSALGTSAHILTYKKITAIQKALKVQRIEVSSLEVLSMLSLGVQAFESYLWKKEYHKFCDVQLTTLNAMSARVDNLTDRINSISLETIKNQLNDISETIDAKSKKAEEK